MAGGGHAADGSSWAQHLINRLNYPRFAIKLQGRDEGGGCRGMVKAGAHR